MRADWWGFELTLPPPTLRTLAAIDNVQSTLFPFLQAVVIGGGVPELAPLIRYISSWVQMELGAIKQQNRGGSGRRRQAKAEADSTRNDRTWRGIGCYMVRLV